MDDTHQSPAQPAPDAELRLVTALKCDIVNSTRIWGPLDPSDALELTRSVKRLVTEVAARRHGHIDCWEGDGALVLFGYPEALEDGAETAVRAGLELVERVGDIHAEHGRLEFRVGIATGTFAVDLTSKSLVGLAFNMAERLKTVAEPGQIVVSDSTKRLAKSFFDYQDLGMRPAKGFESGLQSWAVLGETELSSRFEAHSMDTARKEIIGRARELDVLAHAWAMAREGQGRVAMLVGEAGIGKSRLARAVLERVVDEKSLTLEIDCAPSTSNSPLFPVGVLLRRAAGISAGMAPGEIEALARRFLAAMLREDAPADAWQNLAALFGAAAPEDARERTPQAVREQSIAAAVAVLRAFATRGPTLLLCEDLHWADDTTATVIQRCAEAGHDVPVLLIATTRTTSDTSLDGGRIGAHFEQIDLEPLPDAAAADLVRSVARGSALPSDLVHEIVRRCEGVPLLLEEVTRGTLETATRGERVNLGAATDGPIPAPLQLVIESRLERWHDHKFIMQAASVLGREFSVSLLEDLLPEHRAEVPGAIRLFSQHGLLVPAAAGQAGRARFTHAMIRDAVYQTLVRGSRRGLHSRVADLLCAGDASSPDAAPDAIAQHLCEAMRFEESIRVRLEASEHTVARGAYVETEGHCEAALAFIHEVKDPGQRRELQFRLLVRLGVALTGRHGYSAPQVEHAYRRAREVCGDTAQAEMLFPIMRGLTALNLVRGNLAVGYELSLQSMDVADRSARPEFRIDAMSVHAYATMYYRGLEESREWITRCLALYREHNGETLTYPVPNDPATAALAILPTIEWLRGEPQAAEEAIRRGLAHVDRPNRDFDKAYMHAWTAGVRFTQGRYAQCAQSARTALEIARKFGFKEWLVTASLLDCMSRAAMQPDPDALKIATDTCMALAQEGVGLNASWYLLGLARGYRTAGMDGVAMNLLDQALLRAQASNETRMNAEVLIAKAELLQDAAQAQQMLDQALSLATEQGAVATALRAAAARVLHGGFGPEARAAARAAKEIVDGRADDPPEPDWMRTRLDTLRRVIAQDVPSA